MTTLFDPVAAFQEDVADCLASLLAWAFVGIGPLDPVEVGQKADFSRAHLCDYGTYCPVHIRMGVKYVLSWSNPESEKFSAMFGCFP